MRPPRKPPPPAVIRYAAAWEPPGPHGDPPGRMHAVKWRRIRFRPETHAEHTMCARRWHPGMLTGERFDRRHEHACGVCVCVLETGR